MGRVSLTLLISFSLVCLICGLSELEIEEEFEEFVHASRKEFATAEEKSSAYDSFSKSLAQLRKHQRQKAQRGSKRVAFDIELNKFALMTEEEKEQMNGAKPRVVTSKDPQIKPVKTRTSTTPPASVDWVAKGAVNKPSNQGMCGSCWTFAANGALEAAIQIQSGNLVALSEQNLVDCDSDNGACEGGWPPTVWDGYTNANKLMNKQDYPYSPLSENYSGKQVTIRLIQNPPQSCAYDQFQTSQNYTTKGTIYVNNPGHNNAGDESILLAQVAVAPVSVAIYASALSFNMYKSGVYSDPECKSDAESANHAVLVVGYGTDEATKLDFWKVKNSWGPDWGEGGFIRIKRGGNICGIANWGARPALNY